MTDPAAMPDDLRAAARQKAASLSLRIGRTEWRGQTVWVKKAVPPKATAWNRVQAFIARLASLPVLRPTTNPGGAEGLRIEARRIAEFHAAGFRAPRVLGLTDEWIVLDHLGEMVDRKLQKDKSLAPRDISHIVLRCAEAVAELHRAGLVHGRAKLNDMAMGEDGKIGFIDFEEDIAGAGIPLPALKARDLWLFLCTVARYAPQCPGIGEDALSAYLRVNRDPDMLRELTALLRFLQPFTVMARPFAGKMKGDMLRAYLATRALLISPELESVT